MNTRLLLFFTLLIFNSILIFAQPVTDTVRFDYYYSASANDFTDHFAMGNGLFQIPDSGITGGCLKTPSTISWGNDNAIYCSKMRAVDGSYCQASISFLYDTTTLNDINFDRAASIWFNPSTDWNHYFIAEMSNNNGLRSLTYYSAQNGSGYQLLHNHWYQLNAGFSISAATPGYLITLSDQGFSGLEDSLVDMITFSETDSVLALDQSITISLTGTSYGGAKFLDNFYFFGDTSFSNCLSTNISSSLDEPADVVITNSDILIHSNGFQFSVDIFNLNGQLVYSTGSTNYFQRDLKDFGNGMYVMKVITGKNVAVYKFVTEN
jgi:hypothetical protein